MAIRTLLKYRNLDLTRDLNDRYTDLILPGVFDGGQVVPVVAQLKVDVLPWKIVSKDGMVVQETSDVTRLNCPAGQVTVIAIKAKYVPNNLPEVSVVAVEESAFNLLSDVDFYIILAKVDVPSLATNVLSSYILYEERDILDKISRNHYRGHVLNPGLLPANGNQVGDFYSVVDGIGGLFNLYGWDGTTWVVLTDFVVLDATLAAHRNNLYTNEKHLTDDEKAAVVGTSGTAVSGSNKLIDNADARIPTQDENDALLGSDGTPSNVNRYITQEYPLAVPEELSFVAEINPYSTLLSANGPFYVGKQGLGSANQYFRYYHTSEAREYVTPAGLNVDVTGVYTDVGLTSELNPSIDPNTDVDGFFTGNLYLAFSVTPSSAHRIIYGKRRILGTFPIDALLKRSVNDAQTSADAIKTIEAIKGRIWTDTPPVKEQNINLRRGVLDVKEYLSSVFKADHVIQDFTNVVGVSDYQADFTNNIGIPTNYRYQNSGLITFIYDSILGKITYSAPQALGSVVAGDVFIDGNLDEYKVVSTSGGVDVFITKRNGLIPTSVNTTVTTASHGSIKPDDNPRKINLSTLRAVYQREKIPVREVEAVVSEFHPETGNIAFSVRSPLTSAYAREQRLRMYGGFQNRDINLRKRVVCTNQGRILFTGFFTHLFILSDVSANSPTIQVKIDGGAATNIDLSRSGTVATLGTESDVQQQRIEIASALSISYPHTVEIIIGNASGDFVFHGLESQVLNPSDQYVMPGRAFIQSDLYKSDSITTYSATSTGVQRRGVVHKRYVNRNGLQTSSIYQMFDYDGTLNIPAGVAVSATNTFAPSSGLINFANYKAGDIVKLITASTEEVLRIASITPTVATFSTLIVGSGSAILLHMGSTQGDPVDPTREYARYYMTDLGSGATNDFSTPFFSPSDRLYTVEDGTTTIAASNIQYVTTGIDGIDLAVSFVNASSVMNIRAVCSQIDLLLVNNSAVTADISIDGAPSYSLAISGTGLIRQPIFLNARYQSHEIKITNAANLAIAGIILHEPNTPDKIEGAEIATQNLLARYTVNNSTDSSITSTGVAIIDPFLNGGVYVNGTGLGSEQWNTAINFTNNPHWGRLTSVDIEGSYFEYTMFGEGFEIEYLAGTDRGIPQIFLNGVLANNTNFTATFRGMNAVAGTVDMYNSTTARKRFGISNLPYNKYVIRVQVQTPRQKNVSSSGFRINVVSISECNTNGYLSITPSKGFREKDFIWTLDSLRDTRNFDSGAVVKEEVPVLRTVTAPVRSAKIPLNFDISFIDVLFTAPMDSLNYTVIAVLENTVDSVPLIQPVIITNATLTGFRATWNVNLDTANYKLNYTAVLSPL